MDSPALFSIILLFAVSILFGTFRQVFLNSSCKTGLEGQANLLRFNAASGVVGVITFYILHVCATGEWTLQISGFTLWTAVCFALLNLFSSVAMMLAMCCGPLSYTTLIFSCGAIIISSVVGAILWSEPCGLPQLIGLIVLCIALYIGANPKKVESITVKWLLLCLFGTIFGGFNGIMQKLHQSNELHRGELDTFLILTFALTVIISYIAAFVLRRKKEKDIKPYSFKSRNTFNAVIAGISLAVINRINLQLAGEVPSMIMFPVYNGSVILLTFVASIFVFSEKLTKMQIFGIFLGICSLVLFVM